MIRLANVLLNPKKAEKRPFEIFLVGFFYASISIFLSLWIFPDNSSIVMIFLTTTASIYLVQGAIIIEEKNEKDINEEKFILKKHSKLILLLLSLFLGFLIAFTFWEIVLSQETSSTIFNIQQSAVQEIRSLTGRSIDGSSFIPIIKNNTRVLLFSLTFALLYGAGAIFILAWNASVLGFVIGNLARNTLGLSSLPLIITKYFIHGIPEMLAYFIASLSGGILFISILRGDLKKGRIKRTLTDTIITLTIAFALLIIATIIEVYISSNI